MEGETSPLPTEAAPTATPSETEALPEEGESTLPDWDSTPLDKAPLGAFTEPETELPETELPDAASLEACQLLFYMKDGGNGNSCSDMPTWSAVEAAVNAKLEEALHCTIRFVGPEDLTYRFNETNPDDYPDYPYVSLAAGEKLDIVFTTEEDSGFALRNYAGQGMFTDLEALLPVYAPTLWQWYDSTV